MSNYLTLLFLASLTFLCVLSLPAQLTLNQDNIDADQVSFSMEQFVDRALQHFDDESNGVAGYQIVFSQNGQWYHQESRGWAIHPNDDGGNGVPMETTTRFEVASVSKWLCTIVLANVMDQNNIDWDDPIEPYLPPSWPNQMAPEHFNPNSDCYLTFRKVLQHKTCLGWPGDGSGPLGGTRLDILEALTSDSLNEAENGDYQNGNFVLARMLVGEILVGHLMNENSSSYDDLSQTAYLSAMDANVFGPLNLNIPASQSEFDDFYNGVNPYRYNFPFNPSNSCGGDLGIDYSPSNYNFLGSTGAIISSLELAAIMAYFIHDDTGTIIPPDVRDDILTDGIGLSQSEWNGGNTAYGRYYRKGGRLSSTCSNDDDYKRAFRTTVVAYPNGVEMAVLTNSRAEFLGDVAREWENAWVDQQCTFVHTTTENSVSNHFSLIDHPVMNHEPDRLVFASPVYRPGVGNISPTGVWYNGENWSVFNQNFFPMPVSSQYAIFSVPEDFPLAFKHVAEVENTFNNITTIDHPLLNDNESAELIITQNWGSAPGVFNPHNVGVYYSGTRWTIVNLDFVEIPAGAGFNVYVHPKAVREEEVDQPVGNTADLGILFSQDPQACDPIIITNLYEPGHPFNDSPVGTWFFDGDWSVYNTDFDPMPSGAKFNYARLTDLGVSGLTMAYVIDDEFIESTTSTIRDTVECLDSEPFPDVKGCSFCYHAQQVPDENIGFYYNPPRANFRYINPLDDDIFAGLNFYRYLTDDEAPVLMNVPGDLIVNCDTGDPSEVTASDNCEVEIEYEDEVTGDDCDFIIERTWTATDLAGNSSLATQFIYSGSGADSDGDGFDVFLDCDDTNPLINPAALELCDGIDNDCDEFTDDDCVDCLAFYAAPVDLSKSFDPVNGIQNRVQLKWYKDSPAIKYTDEDAAMCDIKAWAIRELDPISGEAIGPVLQNPDTISLVDRKKSYADGSPRSIFKWPLFYREDGVNNSKRVSPNTRYKFIIRCECSHNGDGPESVWSEGKIFNTPDFDPSSGVFTPLIGQEEYDVSVKSRSQGNQLSIYPNPNSGSLIHISTSPAEELSFNKVSICNLAGQLICSPSVDSRGSIHLSTPLAPGMYFLSVDEDERFSRIRFAVE